MEITIEQLKTEVNDLNKLIENHFRQFETSSQKLMNDGIVNIDEYYNSSIKIMWILKEPYDKNEAGLSGGWSIAEALNVGDLGKGRDSRTWTRKVPVGNIPELQREGDPLTGIGSMTGPIVTRGGLVFLGGGKDKKFMGFDKDTGNLLWETTLPGVVSRTPCTYTSKGKQYVAVSVASNETHPGGYIIAFALPD